MLALYGASLGKGEPENDSKTATDWTELGRTFLVSFRLPSAEFELCDS